MSKLSPALIAFDKDIMKARLKAGLLIKKVEKSKTTGAGRKTKHKPKATTV